MFQTRCQLLEFQWLADRRNDGIDFLGASTILPHGVAVILALTSRLLITGALHEDGLADFFDGFGGGTNRESTLRIMKDSHIGSYGVLGLIIYYLLAYNLLVALPLTVTPFLLLSGDTWSKFISSNIINYLTLRTERRR